MFFGGRKADLSFIRGAGAQAPMCVELVGSQRGACTQGVQAVHGLLYGVMHVMIL